MGQKLSVWAQKKEILSRLVCCNEEKRDEMNDVRNVLKRFPWFPVMQLWHWLQPSSFLIMWWTEMMAGFTNGDTECSLQTFCIKRSHVSTAEMPNCYFGPWMKFKLKKKKSSNSLTKGIKGKFLFSSLIAEAQNLFWEYGGMQSEPGTEPAAIQLVTPGSISWATVETATFTYNHFSLICWHRTWKDPKIKSKTSRSSVFTCSGMKANTMKLIPNRGIKSSVDLASLLKRQSKNTNSNVSPGENISQSVF